MHKSGLTCVPTGEGIDVIMFLICLIITTWWGQIRGGPQLLGASKHWFRRKHWFQSDRPGKPYLDGTRLP